MNLKIVTAVITAKVMVDAVVMAGDSDDRDGAVRSKDHNCAEEIVCLCSYLVGAFEFWVTNVSVHFDLACGTRALAKSLRRGL